VENLGDEHHRLWYNPLMAKVTCPVSGQTAIEERINSFTHGLGAVFALAAFCALVVSASWTQNIWHIVSSTVFGLSLIALYTASTLYHSAKLPSRKRRLKVLDHACIYVLIAGTYTPFTLGPLRGAYGWTLFGIIWGLAIAGVVFKLFYTGRFRLASTLLYLGMGWLGLLVVIPIAQLIPDAANYLIAGGLCYTLGAIFYLIKRMPFQHGLFHIFVLAGSAFHYLSVLLYIIV
jgi:hemolysin III